MASGNRRIAKSEITSESEKKWRNGSMNKMAAKMAAKA